MDIPDNILDELKCNNCEVYLSRGPVYLQHDGAALCGRCFTPKLPAIRNKQYEATAKMLKFPCKNRDLGCQQTVPFVGENEVIAHEEECKHRQYVCPVLGSARCEWLGSTATMLAHCRAQHPDYVLDNPCSLTHNIAKACLETYIISAFQLLFLLHTKVCLTTGKIFHSIRLLGGGNKAANYHFTLDIKRKDRFLSFSGSVAPQGCLMIQEDTSLAVNTNSILDVLDGFDGTIFTVTVKQRLSEAADQLATAVEKCGNCGAGVNMFLYRDEKGWRCKRCVPDRITCKYYADDCSHTDFSEKCTKHEEYFCRQSTNCNICNRNMSWGMLYSHYSSKHQDIKHTAGSTWWVTQGKRYCLVSYTAVDIAVCYYSLNNSQFNLYVYTPVLSEQLREYLCTVRLTNPATGDERTFIPNAVYDQLYDWNIIVNKTDFPSWNVAFDICVAITKI